MDDTSDLKITLEAIDAAIAKSRAAIKRGEALKRLMKNQDFQDVILNDYIEVEAEKLFKILTDPTGASPYTAAEIHLKLEAISHFKGFIGTEDFLGTVRIEADRAPHDIMSEEQYRKEVTAEYAEDGE